MGGSVRELRGDISRHVGNELAVRGLTRRRADEYLWPLVDGFEGWFAPTYTSRPEWSVVQFMPQVGVRSVAVEAMVRRLGGDGARRPWLASVYELLHVLTPDRGWLLGREFIVGQPIEPHAAEMINAFEEYGRPWVQQRASLPALLAGEVDGRHTPGAPAVDCRRIALHVLCGDPDGARAYLDRAREEAAGRAYDPGDKHAAIVGAWAVHLPAIIGGKG